MMREAVSLLKIIERVLTAAIVALAVYAVYSFQNDKFERFDHISDGKKGPAMALNEGMAQENPGLKAFDYYAAFLKKRNIFDYGSADTSAGTTPAAPAGQLPEHLKVVGIILADKPEVVIEDTQSKQTYFVQEGQKTGDLEIERIKGNSVVLLYQGQTIEVEAHK